MINNEKKKIAIYINNKCNRHCPFCYVNKYKESEMNTCVANKIISYLNQNIDNYQLVVFVGGEPTLSPNILSYFINNLKSEKLNYGIMTNGTTDLKKIVKQTNIDYNRLTFNISFKNINDKDNKLKINNMSYLKKENISHNALIVNTPQILNNLLNLFKYLIKIEPNSIKLLRQHKMGDFWTKEDIDKYKDILPQLVHLSIYCQEKFKNKVNQIILPNKINIPIYNNHKTYKDLAINLVDQDSICRYDIVGIDGKQYLCDGACGEKHHDFGYIWDSPTNPYLIKEFGYQDILYDYCYLANNPCCLEFDKLNDKYRKIYQKYVLRLEQLKNGRA